MARLSYADETSSEVQALAAQIRSERGGRMTNLKKMLLNSPPLAAGWQQMFNAIRQQCQLAGRYRELAILRVAIVNEAPYEFRAHVPFARAEGLSQAQIEALEGWERAAVYSDAERAVLAYTDAMTRQIHVEEPVFEALRPHFNAREVVELTATIGGYNLLSRFVEALMIDPEPGNAQNG